MTGDDMTLVREFAASNSETAFTTLVERHLGLVHSAALRQTGGDAHLAEEIAQAVFIILARKAGTLGDQTILSAWLYRTTHYAAADARKANYRRAAREHEAYMQSTPNPAEAAAWTQLAPLLDDAMAGLGETDRAALVLRYFENKTVREIAATLRLEESAAQKRVNRALEKLRAKLYKQGVTLTGTIIAGAVTANSVQAAPVGLAAVISAAALSGTTLTLTTAIVMTTLQKITVTAALAITVGAGIYEAKQAANARAEVQALQQAQAPLAEQMQQLQKERDAATNRLASMAEEIAKNKKNNLELLKLRGQSGQAQTAVQETAKLRTALQQSTASSKFTSDALAQGTAMMEQIKKKNELAKLARMKDKLNLTDSQQQAISDIITKNSEARAQQSLIAMSGKRTPEQIKAAMIASLQTFGNEEAEVKAVLTPEQLAAYPDYQQSETLVAANNRANLEATMMRSDLNLSQDQQDKVSNALYQFALDHSANKLASSLVVQKPGNVADTMNSVLEMQQQELADKLKVLGGILTPDQLQSYRQSQLEKIDSMASAAKFFLPQMTRAFP